MSGEQTKPQVGEWWEQNDGTRYLCLANNALGETVWQTESGGFNIQLDDYCWKHWTHLPDCDSWDWKPETWPKFYIDVEAERNWNNLAYVKHNSDEDFDFEYHNGINYRESWRTEQMLVFIASGQWIEVTEGEALARIKPPEVIKKRVDVKLWV